MSRKNIRKEIRIKRAVKLLIELRRTQRKIPRYSVRTWKILQHLKNRQN